MMPWFSNTTFSTALDKIGFILTVIVVMACSINKPVLNIAGAMLLLVFILYVIQQPDYLKKALHHPMVLGCLIWLSWLALTILYASNRLDALYAFKGYNWLLYPLVFFPFLYQQHHRIRIALGAFIGMIAVFLIAIYANRFILPHEWNIILQSGGVAPVPAIHFNTAVIFMLLIVASYSLLPYAKAYWQQGLLLLMGLSALFAEVAINTSRMGYVTEIILIFIILVSRWRLKGLGLFIVIAGIGLTSLNYLSHTFSHRVTQGTNEVTRYYDAWTTNDHQAMKHVARTSVGSRLLHLDIMSQNMPHESLWRNLFGFGISADNYKQQFYRFIERYPKDSIYYGVQPAYGGPDNNYLRSWVTTGLLGVALMVALLMTWLHIARYLPSPYQQIGRCGLLIFALGSAFANPLMNLQIRTMWVPVFLCFMMWPYPSLMPNKTK